MPLNTDHVLIQPFQPADQSEVKELILAGLAEYWGALDPSRNSDLDDITITYGDAFFLVARLDARLVGSGALVSHSHEIAQIVRMSVLKSCRRRGIGSLILKGLLEYASQAGYDQVVLETTASWTGAIEFYQVNGFQVSHYKDSDIYLRLDLNKHIQLASAVEGESKES